MRTKVGLWIDHRKAVIVAVTDKGEELAAVVMLALRAVAGGCPKE